MTRHSIAALVSPLAWPPYGRMHFGWLAVAFFIASLLFGSVLH